MMQKFNRSSVTSVFVFVYRGGLMGAIGLSPIFDFKKYHLDRKRVPSLVGGNPEVSIVGAER